MYLEAFVFTQQGCGACAEAEPHIRAAMARYATCVKSRVVDVGREQLFSDAMKVQSTPTLIGCANFQPIVRMVGADDAVRRIEAFYARLVEGHSCEVK